MIDLHSHILPGIDDGAKDMAMALEMARIAVAEGTTTLACTPHIQPGVYENSTETIVPAIAALQTELQQADIALTLVIGADVHVSPYLPELLKAGTIPSLAGSRYFLFEPPHHVCPPHLDRLAARLLAQGFTPILTHPERLTWIERGYDLMVQLDKMGVAIQITAASFTGRFGERAQYWAERMLDEGRIDIIASDAHSPIHRPPGLQSAFDIIATRQTPLMAQQLTQENPALILANQPLLPKTRAAKPVHRSKSPSGLLKWLKFGKS